MKGKLPKRNQVVSLLGHVQYISTPGILTSNFDVRQKGVKNSLSVLDPRNYIRLRSDQLTFGAQIIKD